MDNLIKADDVRKYCLSKAKFDVARFEPFLEVAELDYIKPFLGEEFYAEIRTQYLADTLTAANQTLVTDYLARPLAWVVLAKALPYLNIDITNSGLQRNSSEFTTTGTKEERADLVTEALSNARVFIEKARTYLVDQQTLDSTKFPLYSGTEDVDSDTQIIGGIILDNED